MSEYRFFSYTDFEFNRNITENFLQLPLSPYIPPPTTTRKTATGTDVTATSEPRRPEELTTELNVTYTVFEILVAIVAIIGNLMVIIVFQRDKKLRRRTNYYIVSLAIADFLVGLLGVPFAILASVGLPTNLHACLFTVSLLVVLCTISIFCLVAVSIDRYWAILYPMAYSRNVRTKTAIGIISMCWLAGSVVGFLPLFGWHADVTENQACLFVEVMDYNYLVFLYFATIITPAIVLLAFYTHIYRVIVRQVRQTVTMNPIGETSRRTSLNHQQPNQQSSNGKKRKSPQNRPHGGTMLRVLGAARKRDVKAAQNLSIIVLFFMICWIPLYTINCIKAFCPDCYIHPKLTFFGIILSHLNSAVNPVLYAYHLKDFRAALKTLILKILGVETEHTPDLHYRISLASQQQRFNSLMDKRTPSSLQNRIYIDSPIWLRQQQKLHQQQHHHGDKFRLPTISCSLGSVHHTVAAVASATADFNRDMWQIVEVPNISEHSTRDQDNGDGDVSYKCLKLINSNHNRPPSENGSKTKFEQNTIMTNLNESDSDNDDVFLPSKDDKMKIKDQSSKTPTKLRDEYKTENNNTLENLCNLRIKLKGDTEDGDKQTLDYLSRNILPKSITNSCSDISEEQLTTVQLNSSSIMVPATSDTSLQSYSLPTLNGEVVSYSKYDELNRNFFSLPLECSEVAMHISSTHSPSETESCGHVNKVFAMENDTNLLSPSDAHQNRPQILRRLTRTPSPYSSLAASKRVTRSSSCTNDSEFVNSTRSKFSPIKMVNNLLFPSIVKHSSLFQIFDYRQHHKSGENITVNKKKRTSSDSQ